MALKYLQLDAKHSTTEKIVFSVVKDAPQFEDDDFEHALSNSDLSRFAPRYDRRSLKIAYTTQPTVAEAFDNLIGEAIGRAEHRRRLERQQTDYDKEKNAEALAKFRESQGLLP